MASGPVPERSDRRRRRNKVPGGITKVALTDGVVPMPDPEPDWHPIARAWYESLAESGQRRYYEPSDWQRARFAAQQMSLYLKTGRASGHMLTAVNHLLTDLLDTEASRRRMRLEIERTVPDDDAERAKLSVLRDYDRNLGPAPS